MASVRSLGIATSLTLSLAGCFRGPAVRADGTVPLRRVVIYRNGVGYFERHGRAARDGLEFHVRESDVGDFLATLAVMDSGGGSVRAAAFPSNASERNAPDDSRRTVRLAVDSPDREVSVGYTVEAPIWRPSYRLVYDGHGEARLQVWGLVQNHSGEDWRNVRLSLVAGAPVAFRADLANARTAPRPTVTDNGEVIQGVPHGDTALAITEGGDRDGDGIVDSYDRCPTDSEDRDGLEDTDGCPEPDNDHDRIADVDDRCPNEPEVYNGTLDDDGCPDVGRVIVEESSLQILDRILFDTGSDRIPARALPIVEAIARALVGNPQITRIEIEGHAEAREHRNAGGSAETLAMARARAVLEALTSRGVQGARLAQRYTVDHAASDATHARRVEFHVLTVNGEPIEASRPRTNTPAPPQPVNARVTTPSTPPPRNVAALAAIATMGAATRYDLPGAVTIPNGSASMVLLLSVPLHDDRLYLFAPDDHVQASSTHPFQIARFRNPTGGLLEGGPVALFDDGAFLGQGLLDPLPADATATIPFAIERGVVVENTSARSTEGARLVRMHRDGVVIERSDVTRTTYTVRNGIAHAVRVLVRHRTIPGVALASPPAGTEQAEGAALVPIQVAAQTRAAQQVQTRVPFMIETRLDDDLAAEAIESYLRDGHPAAETSTRLRTALDLRAQLRTLSHERTVLEARRADLTRAVDETRMNLLTLERSRGAAELRGQLAARLARNATEVDALLRRAVEIDVQSGELRVRLAETLREIDFEAR